jgi:rhamnulokinase
MQRRPPFLCLTVDLGAESGRVAAVLLQSRRFSVRVLHRFEHQASAGAGGLHWDLDGLWQGIERGLDAAWEARLQPAPIGVDGWGVDHVLAGADGRPLGPSFSHRDARGVRGLERLKARLPLAELYRRSGLPYQPFNTLSQWMAQAAEDPGRLRSAARMMLLPDHLHERLSGRAVAEWSNASTTQLTDPVSQTWNLELCRELELPTAILPPIARAGTVLGPLRPSLARRFRLDGVQIALPATHDTASAVAAVPTVDAPQSWAFISSGTWSLMGMELDAPVLSPAAAAAGMSNEGGVDGSTRFLRNISGLWLLQRLRRELAPGLPYSDLIDLARNAPAARGHFDVDHPSLLNPPGMAAAIRALCPAGRGAPDGLPALLRCTLESLALEYRRTLDLLRRFSGKSVERIHIVGGGSQNDLLCRMTADACGIPVLAGPVEATSVGNALMQARAMGAVPSLQDARRLVAASFNITVYPSHPSPAWDEAYARYLDRKETSPHAPV